MSRAAHASPYQSACGETSASSVEPPVEPSASILRLILTDSAGQKFYEDAAGAVFILDIDTDQPIPVADETEQEVRDCITHSKNLFLLKMLPAVTRRAP